MPKVETSIVIHRPIEEVFAVLSDRENNPKWVPDVLEVRKTSAGPIGVGTTWREVRKLLGQRLETDLEYVEYEPNRKITVTIKGRSGPFAARGETTLERVDGGTRIESRLEGETGGFFKLADPLLEKLVRRQTDATVANLKDLLEARAL